MKNEHPPLLHELGRKISDTTILMHEAVGRKTGLTGMDHKYLSIILQNGTVTAGKLSELTGLTTGAVTGLIDRLEKQKLVKRTTDKKDRRKVLIVPNIGNVHKRFEHAHADLKEKMDQLIATFSPDEVRTIEKYLTSAIEIMQQVTKQLNNS